MVNFCWFLFKWCLLLGLVAVILAAAYLYRQMDEGIRCRIEERIARQYPDLKVRVRSASLVEGEGIDVRGLTLVEPGAAGPRAELLQIEQVFLRCRTDLNELVRGEPEITEVVLRRPTLSITRRPDGTWSARKLLPIPSFGRGNATLTIENGAIEVFDPMKNPTGHIRLGDIDLALTPAEEPPPGFGPRSRSLRGSLSGDFLRRVVIDGLIDPDADRYGVRGSVDGLEICPELRHNLPEDLEAKCSALGPLRGTAKFAFRLDYSPGESNPLDFEITSGQLSRGRVDDPRLPHPLTEVRAGFRVSARGFTINELVATTGPATIQVRELRSAGLGPRAPLWLDAEIRHLELDRSLLDVLPQAFQEHWRNYLPEGRIHANLKASFDGTTWKIRQSVVECLNASFCYHQFPYRLRNVCGFLRLNSGRWKVDLAATAANQPVRISGEVADPSSEGPSQISVRAAGVPLDRELFEALPEKTRELVLSLSPRGTIDVFCRLDRDRVGLPIRKHVEATLNDCRMCYAKFPYPLSNVRGTLVMDDGHWSFREMTGRNDTGRVVCEGGLTPLDGDSELVLSFRAIDVPLEEELRNALNRPNMGQLWRDLRLVGMIDFEADVRYRSAARDLDLVITARPKGDTTSIKPVWLPYRLGNLQGEFVYRDGHMAVQKLQAEHGRTKVTTAVQCDFLANGSWHLHLERLFIDQLQFDRELTAVLPGRLKETIAALKPTRPMNVHGVFNMAQGGHPGDPLTSGWDLRLDLYQGDLDVGVRLENVHGSVTLNGAYDGLHLRANGELDLDSLTYQNLQFTQVMGPLQIADDRVFLGAKVESAALSRPRSITAKLFGGTLRGDGSFTLGSNPRYRMLVSLVEADLSTLGNSFAGGGENLRGKAWGQIDLGGSGKSLNALWGTGNLKLRQADVYEFPLMIQLLRMLGIADPDRSAFSTADIDFRIEAEHVYLDHIDFNGDIGQLEGRGEMDFDSSIRLTFRALPGRREWHVPVFKELLGGASEQLMVIHVGGTLRNPVQRREPFPGVNQMLQQFHAEMERAADGPRLFPHAGQQRPNSARSLPKRS